MIIVRTLFAALLFFVFAGGSFAQAVSANDVPTNVHETFYARFQRVTEAKWEKRENDMYFVSFRKNNRSIMAEFQKDGRWMSTGEIISVGQLPRSIIVAVAKNMKGHRMKSGLKQETYLRGVIYTVSTEHEGKTYDFTFNPTGKLLYYKDTTPVKP